MRFKSVRIRTFKRFTDLTIQGIPETARVIILVGPNGCGKSSFFDALHTWHRWTSNKSRSWDTDYHTKAGASAEAGWNNQVSVEFHDPKPQNLKKAFHVRSAYRNDPDFQIHQLQRYGDPLEEIQVNRMIDNDASG